jgi:hypothetical protein
VVLEDIRQLVALGAEHITFGDPDFSNGIKHSFRILEALHAESPALTFDVTVKIEHLLEHRQHLARLRELGCLFVVSAVEAVDDGVLQYLAKGHSRADVEIALGLAREAGLVIRPTWVPFTPWLSLDGYRELLAFVARHKLVDHVDPVQYAIRLLVPRGSSLLGTAGMDAYLGAFDPATFSYTWAHPDPRMDRLQQSVSAIVERAAAAHEAVETTFERVVEAAAEARGARRFFLKEERHLAEAVAGAPSPPPVADEKPPLTRRVPRLTEAWFC